LADDQSKTREEEMRVLLTLAVLTISPVVSAVAQEQNTVDPEVRQQIEAALTKFDEAFSKNDATATAALYTQDAAEVVSEWSEGGLAFGQQAIEKRHAANFASNPGKLSHKLLQVHAIGNEICAISEWSMPPIKTKGSHHEVTIYVREADDWRSLWPILTEGFGLVAMRTNPSVFGSQSPLLLQPRP
jgi:ketosteroid isomerase-like protein